jgi:hypothetical protein
MSFSEFLPAPDWREYIVTYWVLKTDADQDPLVNGSQMVR